MSQYRPTVVQRPPTSGAPKTTPESRYWAKYSVKTRERHTGRVAAMSFCASGSQELAIAASTRITTYNKATQTVRKTISRFHTPVNSVAYRPDGKMLAGGSEDGLINVFDTGSRTILRTFPTHQSAVNAVAFLGDGTRLLSASNDKTVRLFDLPTESEIVVFTAHTDSVRCLVPSPVSETVFFTGSYDHTARMFDAADAIALAAEAARAATDAALAADAAAEPLAPTDTTKDVEAIARRAARGQRNNSTGPGGLSSVAGAVKVRTAALTVNHGAPIQAIAVHPSGALLYTAGDTTVKVWDVTAPAGSQPVAVLPWQQKTVTALAVDPQGARLLVASLDGVVKIYDTRTYRPVHAIRYSSPLLSIALSPCGSLLAVGHADGTLSLRYRPTLEQRAAANPAPLPQRLRSSVYAHFNRGTSHRADEDDLVVEHTRKRHLAAFDAHLRSFAYGAALDAALATGDVNVVATVVEELLRRGGLGVALGGRDDASLETVLLFVSKHLALPRVSALLADVLGVVLDLYTPVLRQSVAVDELLWRLQSRLKAEIAVSDECARVKGELDLLLAAADAAQGYVGAQNPQQQQQQQQQAGSTDAAAAAAAAAAWGGDSEIATALKLAVAAAGGATAAARGQYGDVDDEEDAEEDGEGEFDDEDEDGDLSESRYENDDSDFDDDDNDKPAATGKSKRRAADSGDDDESEDEEEVRAMVKKAAVAATGSKRSVKANF